MKLAIFRAKYCAKLDSWTKNANFTIFHPKTAIFLTDALPPYCIFNSLKPTKKISPRVSLSKTRFKLRVIVNDQNSYFNNVQL